MISNFCFKITASVHYIYNCYAASIKNAIKFIRLLLHVPSVQFLCCCGTGWILGFWPFAAGHRPAGPVR